MDLLVASFETAASRPPQDEVYLLLKQKHLMLRSARSARLEAWASTPIGDAGY